jgi:hypothetical protein
MFHRFVLGALVMVGGGTLSSEVRADSLRCGRDLVSSGDSTYEVRSTCGDPDAATQRTVYRTVQRRVPVACPADSPQKHCYAIVEETVSVVVDEWTYDFGKNRFVHYVVFEHGRLVSVSSGGYGKKAPA